MRTSSVICIVAASASACFLDGELKHRNTTIPEKLDDGWEIATPEEVGLDVAALRSIHEELLREDAYFGTIGFLVIKDNKLVFETYLRRPEDRDTVHHLASATKSFTSLLFGIARDRGAFSSLDSTLGEIFPEKMAGLEAKKSEITLRHLLTMRSGISFENDVFSYELWVGQPEDPLRYILEKPLYADPGERYLYRDADPQLVAYALQHELGRTEEDFAREVLFEPLEIRDVYWQSYTDGTSTGAYGLYLRPRDFAKIGQVMLDHGEWKGRRIVSETWCATSVSVQTETDRPYPYGFYWWVVNDQGFAAAGHGGQFVFVVPEKNMVLVQIAFPDADRQGSALEDFVELVGPLL